MDFTDIFVVYLLTTWCLNIYIYIYILCLSVRVFVSLNFKTAKPFEPEIFEPTHMTPEKGCMVGVEHFTLKKCRNL